MDNEAMTTLRHNQSMTTMIVRLMNEKVMTEFWTMRIFGLMDKKVMN